MDRFVSHYRNKVDGKGRVSVPAPFRAAIAKGGFDGVFCYPSLDSAAIDAGGQSLMDQISGLLEAIDPYSDGRDTLSLALFGQSDVLKLDQDGRAVLTEALRAHAGIEDQAIFVGLGDKFQIWEPDNFQAHLSMARERVQEHKRLLGTRGRRAQQEGDA